MAGCQETYEMLAGWCVRWCVSLLREGKNPADRPDFLLWESLPSRFHFRQRDGRSEGQVPSEMATGGVDGNCLERLPSRSHFRQKDGKSGGGSTIGTGSWKDKMVIVWRVYHQDFISGRGMVKAEGQVPSVAAAGSHDGNCLETLPSRLHFWQRDGKSGGTSTIRNGSKKPGW